MTARPGVAAATRRSTIPPMRRPVLGDLRFLGVAAVAGVLTGIVVAGLGGRLVMKVIAVAAGPSAVGRVTGNGNTVGDLTLEGTVALVVFSGVFEGLVGGLLYLALRPWLTPLRAWRGLGFGVAVLALMGHVVLEPDNFDFRVFGSVGLSVGLFAALFLLYGLVIAPVFERVASAAGRSRAAAVVAWLGVVPAILFIALGIGGTVAGLLGLNPESRPVFGLLILGTLLAGALGRLVGPRRPAALAIVALPVLAGAVITGTAIGRILGA